LGYLPTYPWGTYLPIHPWATYLPIHPGQPTHLPMWDKDDKKLTLEVTEGLPWSLLRGYIRPT
jgi:hypothetical protein